MFEPFQYEFFVRGIIAGALLLMVSPTQYSTYPELSISGLVFGFIIGGIGFYLKFVQGRKARNES